MSERPWEPFPESYWRAKRHRPAGIWVRAALGFLGFFAVYQVVQVLMALEVAALGALLVTATFAVIVLGAHDSWRRWRTARQRAHIARGGAPWEVDRPWSPKGETSGPWVRVLAHPVMFGLTAMVVSATRDDLVIARVRGGTMLAVAALSVLVVVLAWAGYRGGATVQYGAFPLRTGGPVVFDVATSTGGPSATDVRCTLRCVRTPFPKSVEGAVLHFYMQPLPHGMGPDEFARVSFDVPADAAGTDLMAERAVHWELVVVAVTTRGPLCEVFIVPVYAA